MTYVYVARLSQTRGPIVRQLGGDAAGASLCAFASRLSHEYAFLACATPS